MNNTKPIAIPRDLKPGDRLWYSKTECATIKDSPVNYYGQPSPYDRWGDIWALGDKTQKMYCYREDGHEVDGETPPIIRIERIASAEPQKAKVDNSQAELDAAYLLRLAKLRASAVPSGYSKYHKAQIRAIARRLQKGTP